MGTVWLAIPPLMLAIIIHEVAHGVAAYRLGDDTAKRLGRLTLNPIPHVDIMGTIIFPAMQVLMMGRVFFGWAKPVPVAMQNLRHPFRDMALVAIAGPASNLAQAMVWAALIWGIIFGVSGVEEALVYYSRHGELPVGGAGLSIATIQMAVAGVHINLILMLFNLIPIPPLDGSRVLAWALPRHLGIEVYKNGRWGMILLFGLLMFAPGVLFDYIIDPIMRVILMVLLP